MRKRNWTLFAVLAALAALAALSIGSAGSATAAAGAAASGASASGGEKATAARRRGRRGPRGRRGRRGPRGTTGATGAPGPQGPPGQVQQGGTVFGGWVKIFFAANGVAPTTTLIDANNLNFQTDCTGADHDPEFRTLTDNAAIKMGQVLSDGGDETDETEYNANRSLDTGEVFDENGASNTEGDGFQDDDANSNVIYANTVGQIVEIKIWMVDDADSMFNTVDCFIGGGYVLL